MLYRFIFKILKELAETQQDLEITRSSNMTILTLLLEKKSVVKKNMFLHLMKYNLRIWKILIKLRIKFTK